MKATQAALGFRVKSGWAVAILMSGSVRSPHLCDSRVINLSDPCDPATRQPYHAAMGLLETNATKLKRRTQSVRRTTEQSVVDLLQRYIDNDYKIRFAGLVVGSVIDPRSIANPHIRAHALEGRLFRTTLAAALQSRRIRCAAFTERGAYATAAEALGKSPTQIKYTVTSLGDSANGAWRAEQKLAALAAWMALR
ncbi:MAG: hypothetical protein DME49_08975 [Verrucomicrobia bacterium]|nr:MAG: hypothetical protein DME49_08975 [Verrucomicrobiota bacterium]PYK92709.1 MAG: hypothetical protein DME36_12335 [Verrucomicrobiota bacterium]PYL56320.1 MAG: hypothetical protein DMF30_10215 [Verrucomicrobiota bacterium]